LDKFRKLTHSFFEVTITSLAVGLVAAQQSAPAEVNGRSPISFSADEGGDIGLGEGTAVAWSHAVPFKFTGKISKVTIELKPMAAAIAVVAGKPVGKSL